MFGPPWPDPFGPTVLGHCSSSARLYRPRPIGAGRVSPPQWGMERFARPAHGRGPSLAQATVGRRWKSRRPVTMPPPRTVRRSGLRAPDAPSARIAAAHAIFAARRAAPSRSTSSPQGRSGSAPGFAPPDAPCCSGSRLRWSCRTPAESAARTRRMAPPAPRRYASSVRSRGTFSPQGPASNASKTSSAAACVGAR